MTGTEMECRQPYNAVTEFIDSHLAAGRADKTAVIDVHGEHSYGELADQVNRAAAMLRSMGLRREARIAMIMDDTLAFPALFWGAIKAGVVPIPLNILLTGADYQGILADCRAQAVFISRPLYENVSPALKNQPFLSRVIIDGASVGGHPSLQDLLPVMESDIHTAETHADEVAFWLYSSGSTGAPKGVMHLHRHLRATADLFGRQVLGIEEDDRIFSAAKLFFAYGLGNGMTFPFAVGATAVYLTGRPTPDTVMETLRTHQPTIYCGVPTLYAAILAEDGYGRDTASKALRRCVSAGEALPKEIGERWEQRFGAEILDGVGSTEMLHIFLSNRPGQVSYGSSGVPVPGYHARLVDEEGAAVSQGEVGELLINGPSAAAGYWNRRDKSLDTFEGRWTRTGDKYYQDERGLYHYCGRTDDMMKVSGQWVSPFEVESALIAHESVLEAAVIPDADEAGNIKTKAYVVMKPGKPADVNMLQDFVKNRLARWKYPRSIEFIDELPKTATGKIQRFKLRQRNEAR
jgi:4-hydroxybenzoate-CoA ligase/benzoate-CoA ligase